ncbi:MAG: pantetheine-phosphate adenylyltransferase [Alphaproteobacteria bacterium]
MSIKIAVYPGTFDPITNGHIDIITRACKLVDKLIVGVAVNVSKTPLFSTEERIDMIRQELSQIEFGKDDGEVVVMPINNLLIDFASSIGAKTIFRGLRAVSDFDYEFKMSVMNSRLNSDIETVFLMASENNQFVSSVFVKEIVRFGGDVSSFVTPTVKEILNKKIKSDIEKSQN